MKRSDTESRVIEFVFGKSFLNCAQLQHNYCSMSIFAHIISVRQILKMKQNMATKILTSQFIRFLFTSHFTFKAHETTSERETLSNNNDRRPLFESLFDSSGENNSRNASFFYLSRKFEMRKYVELISFFFLANSKDCLNLILI